MSIPSDLSLADVVSATNRLADRGHRMTHLGICPMSEQLIRIPVALAAEYDFPLLFVASRNQVSDESGGGYVMGLTPETLLLKIREFEDTLGLHTPAARPYLRFVEVDHCGPWYRENEKSLDKEAAVASVQRTLAACIQAGYSAFHIDCSFAPPDGVLMEESSRIGMTADLFEFTEQERTRNGLPPVSYEIGTEETAGASVSVEHFAASTQSLLAELRKRNLPDPTFVVGRTGAKIEMLENVGGFDYTAASALPKAARDAGIGFKEHNADYLSTAILSLHKDYGITCANVGPSFAAAQTGALLEIARMVDSAGRRSDLYSIMSRAVLEHAPFAKWLRAGDTWTAGALTTMPAELRAVTTVAGHYVYFDEEVRAAVAELFNVVKEIGILADPEEYVAAAVRSAIMRYVDAFNLRGSTTRILRQLREDSGSQR